MHIDLQKNGYSVAALRRIAQKRLPRPIFDFIDGGAEDEDTLRQNESAFLDWELLPKPLNGAAKRDLSTSLFGYTLSSPLLIGPTGLAGLFWPQGEVAAANAASNYGTAYCLSHGSVCTLEQLAKMHQGLKWMQVFIYKDRGFTRELATRAQQSGYDALVLTIDNQLIGKRERDIVNGFTIPPRLDLPQMLAFAKKPSWWWAMRHELANVTFGNYVQSNSPESVSALAARMGSLLDPSMSWDDVDMVRAHWKGRLILKGVLHPDEASQAIKHGVDAIIVSNHGGRQLNGAIASARALPAVVQAVNGAIPVLLDGGIRRGSDIFKAVALGASAVLIGRPHLWGLSVAGKDGVQWVLEMLHGELDRTMGLAGASNIEEIRTGQFMKARRFYESS
ncbi:MAG: alpha-hydroxy-acid oxidizing protein [Betaproteobacteria bacterium]|jgi:isopentenyl diphosphate isomerase/L-lactate dehydrogenase-like FMN-dependent dehydrogenase|nr:alpha-hydroxy-acid oxidizing protein [Betaproteobacteria bacterium]